MSLASPVQPALRRLVSFSLVGGMATGVYAVLALLGAYLTTAPAALVSASAYAVAALLSYFGHRGLTFSSTRPHAEAAPRFVQVTLAGHLLSVLIPAVLSDWLAMPAIIPVAVTCVAVPLLSLVILPRYVFPETRTGADGGR